MAVPSGTRLGPYEIVAALGAGGMGEVYKARDTRLDRTVAIKILPTDLAGDPDLRGRFEREARAIAALDHPHICAIYDVGDDDGTHFIVMQHLEGETLAARLGRTKGPLPLDQALQISIQIANALDKAHRAGITHRDLKPANIMLTKSGAKLLDFGLAKLHGPAAPISMSGMTRLATATPNTARGTILGTVPYMAPEQVEGREADARSDIWALGAVIYEMATGTRPFTGESPASIIGSILKDTPPLISVHQPLSPPMLARIVDISLSKDPDDRWQSAADVMRDLQGVQIGEVGIGTDGRRRVSTRRELAAWTIAAIAVTAAAITFGRVWRRVPDAALLRLELVTPPSPNPQSFALAPDGRTLVYLASSGAASGLWLRSLGQASARPLSGTGGATFPFWSPDGRSIGFFADGRLKRLDLPDGAPQILADAPAGRGGSWSREGVIIYAPATVGPVMRISASGGQPVAATRLVAGAGSHRWPQFLPDNRHFIFFLALVPPDARGTFVASLDDPAATRVLAAETAAVYSSAGALLFVRQNVLQAVAFDETRRLVVGEPVPIAEDVGNPTGAFRGAFSVAGSVVVHRSLPAGRRQLVWMDRQGREQGQAGPEDDASLAHPQLSPDGRRVLVARLLDAQTDVWMIDVVRSNQTRLTFDPSAESAPIWSVDGRTMVFESDRNGVYDLFEKPVTGPGDIRPVLVTDESKVPQSWSPDGKLLVYANQSPKTGSDIWVLPMDGDRKPFPIVQTPADDELAEVSPDGRWVAYESTLSGRVEVYLQSFPSTGERWQVSSGGGAQPRWRHDSRELYYVAPDSSMMAAPIAVRDGGRSVDVGTVVPLFRTRIATGSNISVAPTFLRPQYAVAADGRFLMNVSLGPPPTAPFSVVLNWPELLKK